jgi:SnoaL-like domain
MPPYMPVVDKSVFEGIIIATWYDIDVGDSTKIQDYFTPDGRLIFNDREPIVGRQAIRDGYQARLAAGERLSRHVISNVIVISSEPNRVTTLCCLRLYAGDGKAPLPHPEPISVTDQFDTFVRGEDGVWLIEERRLSNLFSDPDTVFRKPPAPKKRKKS